MVNWMTQSDALGVVTTLFWASVLTSLACFLTDSYLHGLLKTHWKPLLVCIALALVWRIPAEGGFFHGLEYEDSYVYTVAGRQMAEQFRIEPSGATLPYSINVCAVGSLTSCRLSDNYPEHLIGYPYILSVLFKVFGYHSSIGSIANVVCACLVDILIFLLCIVIADDVIIAVSAALIFAITPIFAVWGLETSAEPIANGCISLVLWFCLRYVFVCPERISRWRAFLIWCAFTSTLLFSLTVKRENILLPIILPLVAILMRFTNKSTHSSPIHRFRWMLVSAGLALMFSLQLHLPQTQSSQIALLKHFPLTATELLSFLPVFVSSFFVVQWYGGAIILVLVGAIVALRQRNLALFPLILFVGYLLLYAFHIRTYYEMRSGITDSHAALRFSMSLMGLWSILAGLGTASMLRWLRRTRIWTNHRAPINWIVGCTLAAIVGASFLATDYFREDVVRDELRMRIEPSLTAVQAADHDPKRQTYILTLEPLIPQMYANPNVNVISLRTLNDGVMKDIGFDQGVVGVLYLDEQIHRSPADEERYKSQLEYLNQFRRTSLTSRSLFSIIQVDNLPAGNGASRDEGSLGRDRSRVSATPRNTLIDGRNIEQASRPELVFAEILTSQIVHF